MSRLFDGVDDKIDIGDPAILSLNRGFSLSCWFNVSGITAANHALISHGNQEYYIRVSNVAKIDFLESQVAGVLTGGTTLLDSVWYHVCLTVSIDATANVNLYLNGSLDGTTTTTRTFNDGDKKFKIGSDTTGPAGGSDSGSEFFSGAIAYVEVHSVELSLGEVRQLMRFPGSISRGLIGFWPMSGYGALEVDFINRNNGTVTGAPFNSGNPPVNGMFIVPRPGSYYSNFSPSAVVVVPAGVTVRDFNGTTDLISFTSIAQTTVTMCGWAYVDAAGDSDFPRVFDTPAYQLYFGKDTTTPLSGDDNTLKFSSIRTIDGVWNTPASSHANGKWIHCAVTYDSADTANDPLLYLNGVSQVVAEQTLPVGGQADNSGTGTMGNNAAQTRSLDGKLAHLHVYNRILSPNEINQVMRIPGSVRAGLQGYYPLWGGTPESDYSGNNRPGTLTGTTLVSNGPPVSSVFVPQRPFGHYASAISPAPVVVSAFDQSFVFSGW